MLARIAVLASGGGSNLQALLNAQTGGQLRSGRIELVIASKSESFALERALNADLPSFVLEPASFDTQEAYETDLHNLLQAYTIDLVVLAGFTTILSKDFVTKYPERIVNIHPSLIPAHSGQGFYGLKVHESVLAAQETVTGATVHLVNEIPDGGRILKQKTVPVLPHDTPQSLQRRVMEQAEWVLLPQVVQELSRRIQDTNPMPMPTWNADQNLDATPNPKLNNSQDNDQNPNQINLLNNANNQPRSLGNAQYEPDNDLYRSISTNSSINYKPNNLHNLNALPHEFKLQDLAQLLSQNPYPGRGIILGQSPEGKAVLAYFIMGRSSNSRNRTFYKQGDDLSIKIVDDQKLTDASLILYTPLRHYQQQVIISNGNHTDTIYDFLAAHKTLLQALQTRTFEPDIPNYTPRISGMLDFSALSFSYELSILKSASNKQNCLRQYFSYEPIAGQGHFIHTYQTDGNPLPSFSGEPIAIAIPNDLNSFAKNIWNNLHPKNKVALYVRYMEADASNYADLLFNVNELTQNNS